jgi:enamine deaminase RidA (YjgF/YER057c/UK114 family)
VSKPEFFVTPGYGEKKLALHHYTQAVKIDNRVEIAGQGGWNDDDEYPEAIADEIARAFENVERTLALTGATWDHVIHVMVERFRHYMPDQAPIWTCIGVPALGDPRMRVEIRVTAVLPE